MVSKRYLERIGLDEDQIGMVMDALEAESKYRDILLSEGVHPSAVGSVLRVTYPTQIDFHDPALREKVRVEWSGLIVKK